MQVQSQWTVREIQPTIKFENAIETGHRMEKSNIHITDILAVIMLLFMRTAVSEVISWFLGLVGSTHL
jgi:hypothetical protein